MSYLENFRRIKGDAKFKWKLTHGLKWPGIWLIFMRAVESLKMYTRWVPFVESIWSFRWKSTEELSFRSLESDAKFEEKLVLDFKNDMTSLVNFNASSRKFENLYIYVLLLSISYKVLAKKVQKSYHSWNWRVIQTLKKN